MANEEHLALLRRGAADWNAWRSANPDVRPDLRGVCFIDYAADVGMDHDADVNPYADLRGYNLRGVDLSGADIRMTSLAYDLSGVTLCAAECGKANLSGRLLQHANLDDADLTDALLFGTIFSGASLSGTTLRWAELADTVFSDNDLSKTIDLDVCSHSEPSTIDHRTLLRSGPLPVEFLRGCGLSDWEIEATKLYQQNLGKEQIKGVVDEIARIRSAQPIQFYSCFIAYTEADDEFAKRLYASLRDKGVQCYRWREGVKGGRSLPAQTYKQLNLHDKVIVVCSEAALKSGPVIREIARVISREDELTAKGEPAEVLFPIHLDNAVWSWKHYLKADVVGKPVLDFRNWRDEHGWRTAFDGLLSDLRPDDLDAGGADREDGH